MKDHLIGWSRRTEAGIQQVSSRASRPGGAYWCSKQRKRRRNVRQVDPGQAVHAQERRSVGSDAILYTIWCPNAVQSTLDPDDDQPAISGMSEAPDHFHHTLGVVLVYRQSYDIHLQLVSAMPPPQRGQYTGDCHGWTCTECPLRLLRRASGQSFE